MHNFKVGDLVYRPDRPTLIGVVTELIPFNYEIRDMLVSLGRSIEEANGEMNQVRVLWNDETKSRLATVKLIDIYPYQINETE